ncbi:unnamed protein product [Rotaria sp. Silwood1]|nr:unnamed protein product [Rotaria sp. Silwood1]CAF1647194.1 unnamed protein product [Rotaria sp. Silwood1]
MYLGKLVILILHIITCINQYESTPLDDYVNAPDPHFGWTVIKTYEEPDYTLYIVNFTSQKWIDETFSTRSIWWHYLCINVPNHLTRSKTAFMLIDGGSNTDGMPQPNDESVALMSMLAVSTGTWTSAAVDSKRIIGAVPIVMDLVNLQIDVFWRDLQRATGGTYLRRIPNAEHQCIGHLISILLTMRSFYLSIYENQSLPSLTWIKSSNNTHGYIRAIVDFSMGPKPISAIGYRARTLDDKRRDFRLFIANPSDPVKPMANPVLWFTTPLVIESQTNTTIIYSLTIENPLDGWEGFFIQVNFPGPDGSVLELTSETQVIPDTYPTGDCHNEGCAGTLV